MRVFLILFVVILLISNFSGDLSSFINYSLLLFSLSLTFLRLSYRKQFIYAFIIILFLSLFQSFFIDFVNIKFLLNFYGFIFITITITSFLLTFFSYNYKIVLYYYRLIISLFVYVYCFFGIALEGLGQYFLKEANYVYSSVNSMLNGALLQKQLIAPLISFVFIQQITSLDREYIFSRKNIFITLSLAIILPLLLGSRSQTLGLVLAILLISFKNVKPYVVSLIASSIMILFVFIIQIKALEILSLFDIRFLLFKTASEISLKNNFGIGLFNLAYYLNLNGERYLYDANDFLPINFPRLSEFPTGVESTLFQLSSEIGPFITFIFYFLFIRLLINEIRHTINKDIKVYNIFYLAFVLSSLTEDNLFQPNFWVFSAIFLYLKYIPSNIKDENNYY